MNFLYKSRGAISIFMVIIMLPMLTLAGVYVDMARTKLAQELAVSSADLALNTVLTEYDKDLKDFYGLIASAQDVGDVMDAAEEYFLSSMVSAGVNVTDAQIYVDNVMDAFVGDQDVRDLLQISVVPNEEGESMIAPAKDGTLENPAMIKNGIVEFMKYRAPVDGVEKILEKFMNDEITKQLENSGHEAKMIEAREAFYDAEKKLIKQAEKAYKAIKEYLNLSTHKNLKISDEKYLDELAWFVEAPNGKGEGEGQGSFTKIYKEAHIRMVKNYYNTRNSNTTYSLTLLRQSYFEGDDPQNVFSSQFPASETKIERRLKEFNTALSDYLSAKDNLVSAWNGFGSYNSSTDWHVQYWVQLTKRVGTQYSKYVTKAETLREEYRKLENAVTYAEVTDEKDAMDEKMLKPYSAYVKNFPATDNLGRLTLQQVYDTLIDYFDANLYYELEQVSGCTAYRNINNAISNVSSAYGVNDNLDITKVNYIYTVAVEMNKYIGDLEDGEDKAETAASEVEKLAGLLKKYKEAFDKWDKLANDPEMDDSEIATAEPPATANPTAKDYELQGGDRRQIAYWKRNGIEHFSAASVTDLTGRLENIETVCKTFKEDLEKIKYRGTKISKITNFKAFRDAAKPLSDNRIVVNKSALEAYANESFEFSMPANIQRVEIHDNVNDAVFSRDGYYYISQRYHLMLDMTQHDLLDWMRAKFDATPSGTQVSAFESGLGKDIKDEGSAEDADKELGKQKEETDPKAGEGNATKNNIGSWDGKAIPSKNQSYKVEDKTVSAKISEAADYALSLFTDFKKTFSKGLVNMRDDLFTLDYCFSMFTHDTFEKELYYANVEESSQSKVKPANANDKGYYTSAVKEKWMDSDEVKTPTLRMRNETNNWAYCSEIEYILYGNTTNSKNKSTAYANIYFIRYALDLAPVFKMYWNDELVVAIANALQAFAYIPAGITKTIICLAITAGEAGMDVSYLKAGIPVLIYKNKDGDIFCNYQAIFTGGSGNENVVNDNRPTLQYSDYLKLFFFLKLIGDGEQSIYARIGDIVMINTATATGQKKDYTFSKSTVAYSFNATVQIEPMWSRLLAIDDVGDLSTAEGWRTFSLHTMSGY